MKYQLWREVDGSWYLWGTYADPVMLAEAANEIGRMDQKIRAVAVSA